MKANQASEALIQYEAGQDLVAMQKMTGATDRMIFSITDAPWSNRSGYEPEILPDGLITGGVIGVGTGNDKISITDLTCYINGVEVDVTSIADQDVERSTEYVPGETYLTNSITVISAGAIAILQGVEGSSFSTTRGAAGGPPLIPTTSIEIGWVRFADTTPAEVDESEILQIPGTSTERYDFPVYEEDLTNGQIVFISALPQIHVGTLTKEVWCEVYTPIFASLEPAGDFVPPENTHSQSSTQVYGGTIGSSASSLNQGSFLAFLKDGVTDNIINLKDEVLWFKFFPHRLRSPYIMCNGKLGVARTFPAGNNIQAACTISAAEAAEEFEE
jgi:hypothetical protein